MSIARFNKPLPSTPLAPPRSTMTFAEEILQTPNVSANRSITPQGVVFHHTCGTWEGDKSWVMNPDNARKGIYASYHCITDVNGDRRVFAKDHQRTWHAGKSHWMGRSDCNSFMLGFAFSGDSYPDRRFGWNINERQIESALQWLAPRWIKWGLTLEMITDHRQVSPGRKDDLNPIAWEKLHNAISRRFQSAR
jgi:N-acetyl-anhydromuramoyl-L-alanine amidase